MNLPLLWRMGKGVVRELRMDVHTLLYINQITDQKLLYSTGNSVMEKCNLKAKSNVDLRRSLYALCLDTSRETDL